MSEITEAMNMLEDLPESAQDGQQEADEAAATTLQEEAAETAQEATESESKASLPCHRYAVEGSLDGQDWVTLVDRRNNYKDVPNDYVQVDNPARVRYVRYKNIEVPTPHLAISDLRVFGIGEGKKPATVKNFKVVRQADRRDAMITWDAVKNSQGYNIRWGIAPDKLYNSWLLYGKNELLLKSLSTDQPYYFTIEAFNENGVSEATKIQEAQ